MNIAIIWIVLSLVVGAYAFKKGRNGFVYFLMALLLSPFLGWYIVLVSDDLSNDDNLLSGVLKKCPVCAELVKSEALKCQHCGGALAVSKNEAGLRNLIHNIKNN